MPCRYYVDQYIRIKTESVLPTVYAGPRVVGVTYLLLSDTTLLRLDLLRQ